MSEETPRPNTSSCVAIVSLALNAILLVSVVWLTFNVVDLANKAAAKEGAVVHVENKYYAFFNWVRHSMEDIRREPRAKGVLPSYFRRRVFHEGQVDLSEWEDPYGDIPQE